MATWTETAADLSPDERLAAWLGDVLRPVLEDGVVDELEARLLEASWAAYGLTDADAAACAPRIEAALASCVRDALSPLALARLHSARGAWTAEEQAALDEWTQRVQPVAPAAEPDAALMAAVATLLPTTESAPPMAPASAPATAAATAATPASTAESAPTLAVTPEAKAEAEPPVAPTASTRPPVASSRPLLLRSDSGAVPLQARVRTVVNAGMLQSQGADARFFHPDWQFRLIPAVEGWTLEPNLEAPNETIVNGKAVKSPVMLSAGDIVGVGREAKGVLKLPMTVEG